MSNLPKAVTEFLARVPASLHAKCHAYFEAKEAQAQTDADYRRLLDARRAASRLLYNRSQEIDALLPDTDLEVGQIVFNLRNRRYYEVSSTRGKDGGVPFWVMFATLSAKTARKRNCYETYIYGPRLLVPESHPFYQKRLNARLAERLEGQD